MVLVLLDDCLLKMHIDSCPSAHTELKYMWIKNFIKLHTLNITEKKVGNSLKLIGIGVNFLNRLSGSNFTNW